MVAKAIVPSYHGSSSYLLLTKYNNYRDTGGNGQNYVAITDPNNSMTDPITGISVMNVVIQQIGRTADGPPAGAVREWCINSAAIDPFTKSAIVNSEDGINYRWDFTTNTLSQLMPLSPGVGEAYTPTVIGPDGTVYAINDAVLYAIGQYNSKGTHASQTHSSFIARSYWRFWVSADLLSFTLASPNCTISTLPGGAFNAACQNFSTLDCVIFSGTLSFTTDQDYFVNDIQIVMNPANPDGGADVTGNDNYFLPGSFGTRNVWPRWDHQRHTRETGRLFEIDLTSSTPTGFYNGTATLVATDLEEPKSNN